MAGENGGNEDMRKWRERVRTGHRRGRNMHGTTTREKCGGKTRRQQLTGEINILAPKLGGRCCAETKWREEKDREQNGGKKKIGNTNM